MFLKYLSIFAFALLFAKAAPPYADLDYSDRFTKDSLTPILEPVKTFYVSEKTGNDSNPGTKKAPVKSLQIAQNLVRKYRQEENELTGAVKVLIAAGTYPISSTLHFDQSDSGTLKSPTVWEGVDKDRVILSGGTSLDTSGMRLITHEAGLARLHPKARGHVMGLDLSTAAVSGFQSGRGKYGSLSMNGHFLQLAQWPNVGYHHIGKFISAGPTTRMLKPGEKPPAYSIENPSGGKFSTREKFPEAIAQEFNVSRDIQVHGYLHNDWFFQKESVGGINDNVIQLLRHTVYGIKNQVKGLPRRVKLVNVLSELDQPGEWYYDYTYKGLFVWPVKGFDQKTGSLVVPGGETLISLRNTEYFTFRGVTLENMGERAVDISGGHHNLFADSVIRNGKGRGIVISGGKYNGISGCTLHGLESAIHISGGDVKTLERCYNFATNNEIHSCRKKGYGMSSLRGVGIRFAHNLLRDMNGAVSFQAVDLLMEYNEIYNVGYEMGDFNVAYCGAQWWTMGNVLRYNFVHHIMEPGGHPVCPFRNDDGGAGLNIFGNVFYRTGRCAAQFAGPGNSLENNIALDMGVFWWTNKCATSKEAIQKNWDSLARFGRDLPKGDKGDFLYIAEKIVGPKFWEKSPWKDEYPEVAEFIRINPWAQTLGRVDKNYAYNMRNPFHIHGGDGTVKGMESKKKGTFKDLPKEGVFRYPEPIKLGRFEDPKTLNFKLKPSFRAMKDFVDIPFEKIGLYQGRFRSKSPKKADYRGQVYRKFKKDRNRGYDPKIVNARYPIPDYLQ